MRRELNAHVCRGTLGELEVLGDPRANCTYGNFRLDEEDIDLDNALNFRSTQRESERLLRYVVDLSKPGVYKRLGGLYTDSVFVRGVAQPRTRQWALISIPFQTPTDSLNAVNRRRMRALRLTVVSGPSQSDDEPTQLPLAMLRVTGAPWLNRSTTTLAGIGGVRADGGFVVTSAIGTNDSSATLVYQPPPGVINEADTKGAQFGSVRIPINERSMRIQAGNLPLYHRAEAYFRFPSGPQFYQGFQQLRVWGRGRGNGWGQNGDLQMFVKVGRDENNFYLYRAPMNAGSTPAAWTDLADRLQPVHQPAQEDSDGVSRRKEGVDRVYRRRLGDHRRVAAAGRRRVAPIRGVRRRIHGVHGRSGGHGAESRRGAGARGRLHPARRKPAARRPSCPPTRSSSGSTTFDSRAR